MLNNLLESVAKNRTFKPIKQHAEGSKRYELHKKAKETLGSGNLQLAVKLPIGEDRNEWLAVNTVDFFNSVNLLYGSITEFCTATSCEVMSAGPKYEYQWMDGVDIKKPIRVPAPDYVNYLMNWVQKQLDDETVFPSKVEVAFPKEFIPTVKTIFKRLFRVFAHIYYCHFDKIISLDLEIHLNTTFKHFYYFSKEFDLIENKEMVVLAELIENLTGQKVE